jgi:hypothetical protein
MNRLINSRFESGSGPGWSQKPSSRRHARGRCCSWQLVVPSILVLLVLGAASARAANWYVDNAAVGSGRTGTSWANAWTSLSAVVWGSGGVKAGDTLYISGGSNSKVYTETWSVGASGSSGNPIRIALDAANPSHNGLVIFDYDSAGDQATLTGINCPRNYVTFDGNVGGACHIVIRNLRNVMARLSTVGLDASSTTGVVIDHVASTNCNNPVKLTLGSSFRISNCRFHQVRGDAALALAGSAGSWDANLVYSNSIECLFNSNYAPGRSPASGGGPDGIQCSDGISIFGNRIIVSTTSVYTSSQHPDMIQAGGNYMKVYNNEFINVGDSVFDFDCWANNSPHDVWIYNNIFRISETIDNYPEYFRLYNSMNTVSSIDRFKILNNTFVDNTEQYRVIRFDMFNGSPTASGNEIKNNIFYNCGGGNASAPIIYIENSSAFTPSSFTFDANVYYQGSTAQYIVFRGTSYTVANWVGANEPHSKTTAPSFASYAPFAAGNDFHLRPTDTVARDAGLSLSAYFTGDKDQVARPQGSAWDIGAYEYNSGGGGSTNLPPVVSAISQDLQDADPVAPGLQVYAGSAVHYSGSASDPNGDPLSWQWIYTVNGGPEVILQSGTGAVLPAAYSYLASAGGSTYVWKLRVNDGTASTDSILAVGVLVSSAGGLSFTAESGTLTAPFVSGGGYIYQAAETSLANSGRAAYSFTLTNSGSYVVQTLVNAATDAGNSFFVNIDAEPEDPGMVWDIPITTGFESRLVSWRGNGTFDHNQFVPKSFALGPGSHQLIIRGREANTQLQSLWIRRLPDPPTNLRVTGP